MNIPLDIYRLIVSNIVDAKTFVNFCLVNKTFKDKFIDLRNINFNRQLTKYKLRKFYLSKMKEEQITNHKKYSIVYILALHFENLSTHFYHDGGEELKLKMNDIIAFMNEQNDVKMLIKKSNRLANKISYYIHFNYYCSFDDNIYDTLRRYYINIFERDIDYYD